MAGRLPGRRFDAVFSSPMQRALATARLAGFAEATVSDLLREYDYGDYEGVTSRQIQQERPGWELFHDGCPNGETPAQVYARALSFLELAEGAGDNVIAFAHGHILRTLAVAFLELDVTVAAMLHLDVASLSGLQEGERVHELAFWNAGTSPA